MTNVNRVRPPAPPICSNCGRIGPEGPPWPLPDAWWSLRGEGKVRVLCGLTCLALVARMLTRGVDG